MKRMIFFGLLALLSSLVSISGQADNELALQTCYNYGGPNSAFYEMCINDNFSQIGQKLEIFTSSCRTFGRGADIRYLDCVNSNFRNIDRNLGTWSDSCQNSGPELGSIFEHCVNQNFSTLQFIINSRRSV